MSLEMMIVVGFIVGFLVGGTGIGGIILIPALVYLAGLSSHVAMGTTLFTFIFTTILSSYLYIRLGHVDWKATIPICVGGLLFSYVGAAVKAGMAEGRSSRFWTLLVVGSGVGFIAGLTGAGGPVLSVPIMIVLGFPPLVSIAAGQVYSVPVAISGTIANIQNSAIDFHVGLWLIVVQMAGILAGVYVANRMDTSRLRKLVAWVCVFCGAFILYNALRDIIAM